MYIFQRQQNCANPEGRICSLKNLQVLIKPNCRGNHVITCYNVHEETSQKVKTDKMLKAYAHYLYFGLCVTTLHLRYDFVLVLHENAPVFSQSDARNFFTYIINKVIYL